MREFDQEWFSAGPMDYEFKQYILLGKIKRLRGFVQQGLIWPVIEEIEHQLDFLYRFKYEKETLDDKMLVAKDIDFVNFRIIYERPEDVISDQMEVLHRICNEAIDLLEDVYMDARLVWREIEPNIKLTWIPKKQIFVNQGYVAMIHNKKQVYVYRFDKPKVLGEDWRRFNVEKIEEFEWTDGCVLELHDRLKMADNELFARIDYHTQYPFEDAIYPVAKSILYSSLVRDFAK